MQFSIQRVNLSNGRWWFARHLVSHARNIFDFIETPTNFTDGNTTNAWIPCGSFADLEGTFGQSCRHSYGRLSAFALLAKQLVTVEARNDLTNRYTLTRIPPWLWNTFLLTFYDLGVSLSTPRLLLAGVFISAVERCCSSSRTPANGENQA